MKDLADHAGDEQIRRACMHGANYPSLTRYRDLTARRVREVGNPG